MSRPSLITGGCGFVGRHLAKALLNRGESKIWMIDDLSTGIVPEKWLRGWDKTEEGDTSRYSSRGRTIVLIRADVWQLLHDLALGRISRTLPAFGDVFHLASIVGGRALIEGDPLMVAKDLGIDAAFFLWVTRDPSRVGRVLYASSSAAYPTHLQGEGGAIALTENHIDFDSGKLGMPDLTYGWSKLTGEFLSRLAHAKYGIPVACVRPFSGYGEDQDLTYPTPSIALRVARGDDPIEVWGSGEQGRDFVHIDDCVDAFFALLDKVRDGSAANIGSGKLTSFNELIRTMLTIEGRTATIRPLSDKPVGVQSRYADTSYMENTIGWKLKISLEEGLRRTLLGAKERLAGNDLPFSV
jgi:nucleoside-diphosphate-sugar epimerase